MSELKSEIEKNLNDGEWLRLKSEMERKLKFRDWLIDALQKYRKDWDVYPSSQSVDLIALGGKERQSIEAELVKFGLNKDDFLPSDRDPTCFRISHANAAKAVLELKKIHGPLDKIVRTTETIRTEDVPPSSSADEVPSSDVPPSSSADEVPSSSSAVLLFSPPRSYNRRFIGTRRGPVHT